MIGHRTRQVQIIQAQVIREFDSFEYQYGLDSKLVHKPGEGRGEKLPMFMVFSKPMKGYGFEVSNKTEMDTFAARYSKSSEVKIQSMD